MGALSNAEKELIVFVDEGLDERPVFRRKHLGQRGERGLARRQQFLRQAALTALPLLAGLLNRGALSVNGGGQKARQERESYQSGLAQDLLPPGQATLAALTQILPAKYRPLVQALVHENNQLLFRVRQRAHQNHILITRSMQLMQRLIATLVPVQQTPVYDGQGHLSAPAPRGSSLYEAVG